MRTGRQVIRKGGACDWRVLCLLLFLSAEDNIATKCLPTLRHNLRHIDIVPCTQNKKYVSKSIDTLYQQLNSFTEQACGHEKMRTGCLLCCQSWGCRFAQLCLLGVKSADSSL